MAVRWAFWKGEVKRNKEGKKEKTKNAKWDCFSEPPHSQRIGPCWEDDGRQVMRNCPREDLGHEPYVENSSFRVKMGDEFSVCQCPVGLITDKSRALLDMFFDCHTEMPGFMASSWIQICWPTAQTLWDEHALIIEAFKIIRNELAMIMSEKE